MSTQVLIAHSGQRLQVDVSQFPTVDDFKAWVSRQCRIPVQHVVALTSSGKTVKLQTLHAEKDIYIYDLRIIQATSSPSSSLVSEAPLPKRYSMSTSPNEITNANQIDAWRDLFRSRRTWALKILDDCAKMADAAQTRYGEMDVMMRCLDAAVVNLESVIKPVDNRYTEFKKWSASVQEEYVVLANNWENYLNLARQVQISPLMVRFMTGKDISDSRHATLEDLIDLGMAERAGKKAQSALKSYNTKVSELDEAANQMFQGCQDLFREYENALNRSALSHSDDAPQLLQDVEPLAKKVDNDYQTTLEYQNSHRDLLQASKLAQVHTDRHLPKLRERALEMDNMLRYAVQSRNLIANDSLEFMRIIAEISALQGTVKAQMNALTQGVDEMKTFDYLRLVQQLPFMYAAYVAEAIRRREWSEKMKSDSSTLANEMALFQDEETKRRRKWHKMVGQEYGPQDSSPTVLGLEINLRGDADSWPAMTRDDLQDFIDVLHQVEAEPEVISDIEKLGVELAAPTKQQTKRLKAFKNGSVHEAALGRSGLLIRGDNELMQSLRDDKSRLESKLKTAESRVRRLEGLLHQQSQASRPTLGSVFSIPSQQLSERNNSVSSAKSPRIPDAHRMSGDGGEVLLQRIGQLEAELNAEKEKSAAFESDLNARTTQHNDIKDKMDEANSTKKDLLDNIEALQREFEIERKSFEDEIKQLKAKLEDTEDAIDHFDESRENEKASYDEKLQSLEEEVESLKKEKRDELLKAHGQVEFLRNESRLQRETNDSLDKQVQALQGQIKSLSRELEATKESSSSQTKALRDLHVQMSSGTAVPEDFTELIDAVLTKVAEMLARIQDTERDMSLLRSNLDQEQSAVKRLREDLEGIKDRLAAEEMTVMKTHESLLEEQARTAALEGELIESRNQLSQLRNRIADGETGSETLRRRVEETESRVATLTEDLAAKQSQVGSLEEEMLLYKEKHQESQAKLVNISMRLDGRTERAKDLTQRLYSQNDRLCRLLERIGFSVTRKGSSMTLQKIPRSERMAVQTAGDAFDPIASMRKSTAINASKHLAESVDLDLLHWMNADDAAVESEKYEAYIQSLGHFDMELFSDTVYKRLKDVEHIARKLQRDFRSAREKAHAFQKEAHEKIAYKHFKEGDLALFLPTRNQTTGAWAAFNVGFPHYFLREQEPHRLQSREWLVARISRVQERVVDLSKSLQAQTSEPGSTPDDENDNPFDLSDGLRWYLIDAHEDKPGAPSTPGLGKSTVAANNVEAMADRHAQPQTKDKSRPSLSSIEGVSKALSKSLETRRSSTSSRKALPFNIGGVSNRNSALASETNSLRAAPSETPVATSPTAQHAQLAGPGSPQKAPMSPKKQVATVPTAAESTPEQPQAQVEDPHHQPQYYHQQEAQHPPPYGQLQREMSGASIESPTRKSVVWDSLWSVDFTYDSGKRR